MSLLIKRFVCFNECNRSINVDSEKSVLSALNSCFLKMLYQPLKTCNDIVQLCLDKMCSENILILGFQWWSCAWALSWLVERISENSYWLLWTWGWFLTVMCLFHTTLYCTPCHIRWLTSTSIHISKRKLSELSLFASQFDFFPSILSHQDTVFPQLTNSTQLRHAYTSVLTVTMASDLNFYEAFRQAQINREIRSAVAATQVTTQPKIQKMWSTSSCNTNTGKTCRMERKKVKFYLLFV